MINKIVLTISEDLKLHEDQCYEVVMNFEGTLEGVESPSTWTSILYSKPNTREVSYDLTLEKSHPKILSINYFAVTEVRVIDNDPSPDF